MSAISLTRGQQLKLALAGTVLLAIAVAVPAQAATSVSIGGDTNWQVKASSTVPDTSLSKAQTMTGTTNMVYSAHFLGIPIPVTGYYVNSFPTKTSQPTVAASNGDLASLTYKKVNDGYLGTTQWMVHGSSSFWGDASVTVKGTAKASTSGSGYFHGGSGTGHATDTNSIVHVTVG